MKKILTGTLLTAACTTMLMANPAAACIGCHGAKGEKNTIVPKAIPNKMSKADFVKAMKGYADGTYGGAQKMIMKGQAARNLGNLDAIAAAWGLK